MADKKRYLYPGAEVIIVADKEKTGTVNAPEKIKVTPRLDTKGNQKNYRGRRVWETEGTFSLSTRGEYNGRYRDPIIATNSLRRTDQSSKRA